MSNIDKEQLAIIIKKAQKKFGKHALYTLGSEDVEIPRWSSGLPELDEIIGGGIPKGRIIEISGNESAGKTTLAYHLCAQVRMSNFFDAENTFDKNRAKLFGNKKGRLIVSRLDWAEQYFEMMFNMVDAGIPLIVIDSIPALVQRSQFEETNMEKSGRVGGISGYLSQKVFTLQNHMSKSGTTAIFINQVRDKMGSVIMFGDKTDTPGGHAFKHCCSLRIKVGRRGWIEGKRGKKIGQLIKLKIIKSKVSAPQGECEIPFLFDRGFVAHEELKEIRKQLKVEE